MKNRLFTLLRVILPVLLVAWIARQVWQENPDALSDLAAQHKNYTYLFLAVASYLLALIVTFGRWFVLVRALNIPFRFADALRLGFVGYFLQFLSLGTVGGDLFKAVFIAREQPRKRAEAVATVFIDRAVGFLALLLVTCAAFLFFGWSRLNEELHYVAVSCFIITTIAMFVVVGLLWTSATTRPLRDLLRRFPALCAVLLRGEHALQLYRARRGQFLIALTSGLFSHCLLAASAYFAAATIYRDAPSYPEQLVIWNIAGAIATLPLSPGGLGTLEAAYSYLYQIVPADGHSLEQGFTVALLLRVVSVIVAGIGVVVYWLSRREMDELIDQAERAEAQAH